MDEDTTVTTTTPETAPGNQTPPASDSQSFLDKLAEALHLNKAQDPAAKPEGDGKQPPADDPAPKSYTEADLAAKLAEAQQKWEADQAEKARLAKLPPEDRAKAEADAQAQELAETKAQLLQRDLRDTAVKALDKDKYPVGLAELLDYSSKEKMEASLKTVQEVFTASLATAIDEKLRGKTPEGLGGAGTAENVIKDQIATAVRGA